MTVGDIIRHRDGEKDAELNPENLRKEKRATHSEKLPPAKWAKQSKSMGFILTPRLSLNQHCTFSF